MITTQLLRPESIVVVGASNNVHKPGGAILKNLINGGYQGELRAVNPKETEVQGVPAFADVKELPDTDLAVLAVPAVMCPDIVETLASEKQTRAFGRTYTGNCQQIWCFTDWSELHRTDEYMAS